MFSTRHYLEKKTGPYRVDRLHHLQELVDEFQSTETSREHKLQVLANLANFAYDPVNYEFIRQLNIIDLFLDCLSENDETMKEYAVGGLCNLCLDKQNKEYILSNQGVQLVVMCLSSSNEETVLSTITTMMFLMTPASRIQLTCRPVIEAMLRLRGSSNPRLRNLATIYLSDYCERSQVDEAMKADS